LGSDDHILFIPKGTLGTHSDDECSGIPVRLSKIENRRCKAVQEDTKCNGDDLETPSGGGEELPYLKRYWLLSDVYTGKRFVDGIIKPETKVLERMAA
jgi:hypothetical protein